METAVMLGATAVFGFAIGFYTAIYCVNLALKNWREQK